MKKTRQQGTARNVIGDRVRRARLQAQPPISQEDLAGRLAALGIAIDQAALSRVERGERYVLDYEAQALAKSLKVRVAWLFREN